LVLLPFQYHRLAQLFPKRKREWYGNRIPNLSQLLHTHSEPWHAGKKFGSYIFNNFTGHPVDGFKYIAIRKPLRSCSFSDRDDPFLLLIISLQPTKIEEVLPMDEAATGSSAKEIMS